jgi:hypothetical protein
MRKSVLFVMMTAILAGLPGVGGAKGCLKGAVVGGAVGHVAGHHAVAGAAAGCVIEHHREKVKAREARQNAGSEAPRAGTGGAGTGGSETTSSAPVPVT